MQLKNKIITGFSKLTRDEKIREILMHTKAENADVFNHFQASDLQFQETFNNFSENTISNFHLPYSIAPNFLINGKQYMVPMVIEESSVVAAAASAAKFWFMHGGFHTRVKSMIKSGQVYFTYSGNKNNLLENFDTIKEHLYNETHALTENMRKRGGGINKISLHEIGLADHAVWKLDVSFLTGDSMGANFINTCLEKMASSLLNMPMHFGSFKDEEIDIIMAILSNYLPECLVEVSVSCPVDSLKVISGNLSSTQFAEKYKLAVDISHQDVSRAVTHNKGIMNGIDAVVLATGNDFRAIEAGIHAYAAKDGMYRGLSEVIIEKNVFTYQLTVPLSLGTVGGLTSLHKLAAETLHILGNPSAEELMQIVAAAGLANNFSAIKALTTNGIQAGHMKMHLTNILLSLNATPTEMKKAKSHFKTDTVSYGKVSDYLTKLRANH